MANSRKAGKSFINWCDGKKNKKKLLHAFILLFLFFSRSSSFLGILAKTHSLYMQQQQTEDYLLLLLVSLISMANPWIGALSIKPQNPSSSSDSFLLFLLHFPIYTRNGIFVCFLVPSLTLRGIPLRILNLFFVGLLLLCLVDICVFSCFVFLFFFFSMRWYTTR